MQHHYILDVFKFLSVHIYQKNLTNYGMMDDHNWTLGDKVMQNKTI